jgi:hypothetical protein
LRRHAVEPLLHRLDQLCEKRADLQAIVEMQGALRRRLDQRYAKIPGALLERCENAVGRRKGNAEATSPALLFRMTGHADTNSTMLALAAASWARDDRLLFRRVLI